jgi:hypothetical protein
MNRSARIKTFERRTGDGIAGVMGPVLWSGVAQFYAADAVVEGVGDE